MCLPCKCNQLLLETVNDYVLGSFKATASNEEYSVIVEEFDEVGQVVSEHKRKRNKKAAAFKRISNVWTTMRGIRLVEYLEKDPTRKGDATLGNWAKLAEKMEIRQAIHIVNHQILIRNEAPNKIGQSRTKGLVPADVKSALSNMTVAYGDLDKDLAAKHGLKIGDTGLLIEDDEMQVGLIEYEDEVEKVAERVEEQVAEKDVANNEETAALLRPS